MPGHAEQLRYRPRLIGPRYAGHPESKLAGGGPFREYSAETGAPVLIYRFPNLYGKWCRPRYNSAVATFCDAIANGLPTPSTTPPSSWSSSTSTTWSTRCWVRCWGVSTAADTTGWTRVNCRRVLLRPGDRFHVKTLGEIVCLLDGFRDSRETLSCPILTEGSFSKKLWSTFLSYYEPGTTSPMASSPTWTRRGSFTEFLRTPRARDRSRSTCPGPGSPRGNHWHMSKWEKFLVVSGTACIKLRKVGEDADGNPFPVDEYVVSGSDMRAVEMIPGYTHSITNLSDTEDLVTVMWANEAFDPEDPDTYYEEV